MTSPTGIIAFAFGAPHTTPANRLLGAIAAQKARELQASVFTQRDLYIEGVPVSYVPENGSNPPPTLRMARIAVRWALNKGMRELWIVAAAPHMPRCERDLKFAINETHAPLSISICEEALMWSRDDWFCPESTQARTRSRVLWEMRDGILTLMPSSVYARIAC